MQTHNGIVLAKGKRTVLGIGLGTCSYWVDGVIIDTGPNSLTQQFQGFFQERIIEKVALTHSHEDHCGNAALLGNKGIPIYLHRFSVDDVSKPMGIPFYRWFFWRPRPPFAARPLADNLETAGGKKLQVINTPGHAQDHVAFFFPEEGALFTGDLFVSPSTKMGMSAENYPKWMHTLTHLLEYDFDTMYCGHAGIVPNGKKLMSKKLAKFRELQEEILALKGKGMSIKEIDKQLFPSMPIIKWVSGGEWDSIHIVRSFLGGIKYQ